jgi:hypothetical protein
LAEAASWAELNHLFAEDRKRRASDSATSGIGSKQADDSPYHII